jgi:type III secretory pathway component EscS
MLELVDLGRRALLLTVLLSLPAVAVAGLVSALVGALGASLNATDPSIGHLPRLAAVAAVLALVSPWIGRELVAFTTDVLALR